MTPNPMFHRSVLRSLFRRSVPRSLFRRSVLRSSFFVLSSALLLSWGCNSNPNAPSDPSVGLNVPFSVTDLVVGTGTEAVLGRSITARYTGWLYHPNAAENKGPIFDSGTFGPFVLGTTVIAGWNQGIPGMRVGGTRRIVIPPSLGYGASGSGSIPGNATILFEVELLSVQ